VGHIARSTRRRGPGDRHGSQQAARRRLRQVILSKCISQKSRRRIGVEHWRGCSSRRRERYLACPRQPFLHRAVHRRSGGAAIQARSVHTVDGPIIYGLSPLFTAYRRGSSCSWRRRLPRHRCAFHSAPFAFFARMMVLQFIAAFFSMPEARAMALERMNERLRMSGRKSSRRNM
jgi:hypothetical protein